MLPESLVKSRNRVFLTLPVYVLFMQVWTIYGFQKKLETIVQPHHSSHLFMAFFIVLPLAVLNFYALYLICKLTLDMKKNKLSFRDLFRDEFEKHELRTAFILAYLVIMIAVFFMYISAAFGFFHESFLQLLVGFGGLPFFLFALLDARHAKRS